MTKVCIPSQKLGLRWILAAGTIAVVTVMTCQHITASIHGDTVVAYQQ